MNELRLSTFTILDHYPGRGIGDRIRDGIELCELADELGYDSCWVGEHHFSEFGVMPNPAVWLAAVAQRTKRIRLGPAVSVLPFRHPLQVVEDYAIVDQLSRGRLNLAVGSGAIPAEFDGFDMDISEKARRFDEALDVVRAAVRGEPVHHEGDYIRIDRVGTNVPPVSPNGPPLYVATNRIDAARQVGARGDNLLTLVPPDSEGPGIVTGRLRAHREGAAKSGLDVDHAVAIMAHVAESDEAARQNARPALIRFLQTHEDVPSEAAERVFRDACERRSVLCGSPETFAAGLRQLQDAGARHVVLWADFGDLPKTSVERSLRLSVRTAPTAERPSRRRASPDRRASRKPPPAEARRSDDGAGAS